jgi:hypothetical protein
LRVHLGNAGEFGEVIHGGTADDLPG